MLEFLRDSLLCNSEESRPQLGSALVLNMLMALRPSQKSSGRRCLSDHSLKLGGTHQTELFFSKGGVLHWNSGSADEEKDQRPCWLFITSSPISNGLITDTPVNFMIMRSTITNSPDVQFWCMSRPHFGKAG